MANETNTNRLNDTWPVWAFMIVVIMAVIVWFYKDNKDVRNLMKPESSQLVVNQDSFVEDSFGSFEQSAKSTLAEESVTPPVESLDSASFSSPEEVSSDQKPQVDTNPAYQSTSDPISKQSAQSTKKESTLYTIQVVSFRDQLKAQSTIKELQKKGFDAQLITKDLKEKGIWYRIWVGTFNSVEEAKTILASLKKDYPDGFITKK